MVTSIESQGARFFLVLTIGLAILALGFWTVPSYRVWANDENEETVTLDQCPKPVQETIERETAGGTIVEIEKETEDGKTVYEAEFTKDGKEYEITVSEDGTLLAKEEEDDDEEDEDEDEDEDDDEDEDELVFDFEDDEVGKVPEGCLIAETAGDGKMGTWKVIEMEDAPSGNRVLALTVTENSGHTFNLAISEGTDYKDVEVGVKVKAISGEEDQGGGPIWRVQDADNYYIARWNPLEDNFRVYYVKDGRRKQIASAKVKTDPTKWHEIEIEMVGNKIEAEFDDELLIEVEDDTFPEGGMVGVWTKADAATAFDDFEIEAEEGDD